MKIFSIVAMALLISLAAQADDCSPPEVAGDSLFPSVKLETTMGDIVVELDRLKAPITVNNFLRYVLAGHYDGSVIHRIEPEFVVQGGGYDIEFAERPGFPAIQNESGNGLKNRQWSPDGPARRRWGRRCTFGPASRRSGVVPPWCGSSYYRF